MSTQDRVRWDAIYREYENRAFPPPDPLLLQFTPPIPAGETRTAADVAGGMGQNALWLASQGYTVDLMDISRIALSCARAEMAGRNLRSVNLLQVDLDAITLKPDYYDLIIVFRYLKRESLPRIRDAIKPGGRILYETFNRRYLDIVPDFNAEFLLEPRELADVFQNWTTLYDEENTHISQLVAVRPRNL
jgi:SAM-dependent methyltransferase